MLSLALAAYDAHAEAPAVEKPSGPTPDAAAGQPCAPDADLTGLLAAVGRTRAHLTGLDEEAVAGLVAVVETYRDERAGLCRTIGGQAREIGLLRDALAREERFHALCRGERESCWTEMEARIKAPPRTRSRLLSCVVGGALGADLLGETGGFGGPAIACGWSLF